MSVISNKDYININKLEYLCKQHNSYGRTLYCAGLVYKNKIISIGYNYYNKSNYYQRRFKNNDEAYFNHAEMDLLSKSLKVISIDNLFKCKVIIVRLAYNSLTNDYDRYISKPCLGCNRGLIHFCINKCIYYDGNQYIQERV